MTLRSLVKAGYALIAIACILIAKKTVAQKTVQQSNQAWLHLYETMAFNKHWALQTDASYRWAENFSQRSQFIVRAAGRYTFNQGPSVSAGIAHVVFFSDQKANRLEYRPHQELILRNKLFRLDLEHRYRIEERFFRTDGHADGFNFRFRYRMLTNILLSKFRKPKSSLGLNIGEEVFINVGKSVSHNVFDQNRLLIGPVLKLADKMTLSLIWQSHFITGNQPGFYRHNSVFLLGLSHQTNWTK